MLNVRERVVLIRTWRDWSILIAWQTLSDALDSLVRFLEMGVVITVLCGILTFNAFYPPQIPSLSVCLACALINHCVERNLVVRTCHLVVVLTSFVHTSWALSFWIPCQFAVRQRFSTLHHWQRRPMGLAFHVVKLVKVGHFQKSNLQEECVRLLLQSLAVLPACLKVVSAIGILQSNDLDLEILGMLYYIALLASQMGYALQGSSFQLLNAGAESMRFLWPQTQGS